MKKFLIIGGSDAGISAALRARELAPNWEVTMVLADRYPNFSICGLPFYLSGEVTDWRNLAHRTLAEIEHQEICVLAEHMAEKIDPAAKTILVKGPTGHPTALQYDKLMMGTGAISLRPPIRGLDLPGVFFLRWMNDSFLFKKYLDTQKPKSITIIGAGYIGMEMADAMRLLGLMVNVVEYFPEVLMTLDPPLGNLVRSELERQGVNVFTGIAVTEIESKHQTLLIKGRNGFEISSDMVLVATGCRPQTTLAQAAGITLGVKDAIHVNRKMETGHPDIYAAGDCAETYHCLLDKNMYLPLGTTAHKQGRIAGENAIGGNCEYAGSLGTQSVKIFELVAARTGLKDDEARKEGFEPITVDFESWDHKVYYPGAKKMHIRMTGDRKSHRLLGAQIVGAYGKEVSKRIDIIATAIYNKSTVNDLNHLDLSYTPPLSSPWDPVQTAAQEWLRLLKN
ncbi:MAG: FAD-dependent oxidoreductase [Proteobacteria bacterium]|nr:FAD-dependent oxidoreductase [Pseudomonadota bacterium]